MITGIDLLERIETAFPGETSRHFQFPFTRIQIVSSNFRRLDDDERELFLADKINLSIATLRELCNRLFFRLDLLAEDEQSPSNKTDRGHFWIRMLAEPEPQPDPLFTASIPIVHFYGYKGGQGRSTVLCFLARVLANDGWRVLAVDVDAEAPSLDVLFGIRAPGIASSLLGLRAGLLATPVRAVTPAHGRGFVDLLPFRPIEERYDLEAAALAMEGNVHPPSLAKIIQGVSKLSTDYDIILVDHRTGLASTIPPWVRHMPGSVIAFARMDGQWRLSKSTLRRLWSLTPELPSLLVSFNADRNETEDEYQLRAWDQASELLDELGAAMSTSDVGNKDTLTAEEVRDHWVVWPYDAAFNGIGVPDPDRVGATTREKAYAIRRILGLEGVPRQELLPPTLHPSGALDEGDLIQTQALRDLSAPNNSFTFILGRKGTGKTRLLRALVQDKRNQIREALLVPEDDRGSTGIEASNVSFKTLIQETSSDPELLWWTLLRVALERNNTERNAMSQGVDAAIASRSESLRRARSAAEKIPQNRREFLIDGLETAFPRARTFDFVGALFRVIATIDSDPVFSEKIRLRVFIRTDLAERGFENLEQQAYGRTLHLQWDTQSILNFALSRIGRLEWFKREFPLVYAKIEQMRSKILEGALSEPECDALLLEVFPHKLRRLNLNTTTFLRTYFSDTPTGRGSYYPRIYDDFLRIIAGEDDQRRRFTSRDLDDNHHVSDELVYFAHEEAARNFLLQVRAELRNLVDVNEEELARLIDAFRGTLTPFDVERRCEELSDRTGIDKTAVREALERMKTLGIFEDRPKYPGQWRAGRLFKTSLGMLYDRKRKDKDADE